jgi:hypothetical protein
MNLKNKGALSSGIGKDKEFFFQGIISWVGLGGVSRYANSLSHIGKIK